ncbi:hypothetical protein BGZ57DRAFT_265411 [Hyaloscypha finlandica]|nr:hypothetical protein BGZ57DRAFT_265411 [Hyaloscypha finlandica]
MPRNIGLTRGRTCFRLMLLRYLVLSRPQEPSFKKPYSIVMEEEDLDESTSGRRTKQKKMAKPISDATTVPLREQGLFEKVGHSMAKHFPTLVDCLQRPVTTSISSVTTTTTTVTTSTEEETLEIISSSAPSALGTLNWLRLHPSRSPGSSEDSRLSRESANSARTLISHQPACSNVYTLADITAVEALSAIVSQFSRVSHMRILDGSYSFFITQDQNAALYFKTKKRICIVGGDPLCSSCLFPVITKEFAEYRKKHHLGIVFVGASEDFLAYAKQCSWTTSPQSSNESSPTRTSKAYLQSKPTIAQSRQGRDYTWRLQPVCRTESRASMQIGSCA